MTLMHGQAAPVGVPSDGPHCNECEKPIGNKTAYCDGCVGRIKEVAVDEALDAVETEDADNTEHSIQRLRDWARGNLLLGKITKEVREAIDLAADDMEDPRTIW